MYRIENKALIDELQKVVFSLSLLYPVQLITEQSRQIIPAMTLRYVDIATLQRVSGTLTCRSFEHSHTAEHVAQKIADLLKKSSIVGQMLTVHLGDTGCRTII